MSATDPKADIIAIAQIAPKGDQGRSVYGWLRKELGSARADSAMLVDPAAASRENSKRDGSLTCPGPRLCLGASHLYAGGCSDARARRHLGYRPGDRCRRRVRRGRAAQYSFAHASDGAL